MVRKKANNPSSMGGMVPSPEQIAERFFMRGEMIGMNDDLDGNQVLMMSGGGGGNQAREKRVT